MHFLFLHFNLHKLYIVILANFKGGTVDDKCTVCKGGNFSKSKKNQNILPKNSESLSIPGRTLSTIILYCYFWKLIDDVLVLGLSNGKTT